MIEAFGASIAGLALLFGLARHNPDSYAGFLSGASAVALPALGFLFGWDAAIATALLVTKGVIPAAAAPKVLAALREWVIPPLAISAGVVTLSGAWVIRHFVPPKMH